MKYIIILSSVGRLTKKPEQDTRHSHEECSVHHPPIRDRLPGHVTGTVERQTCQRFLGGPYNQDDHQGPEGAPPSQERRQDMATRRSRIAARL